MAVVEPPAVAAPPELPLRRNRDFLLLWSGLVVSTLGSRISATAYPLLVLALTGSPADAGVVGFFAGLPYLLVQLPAGAVVDRVDRKRLMIACDVGRALALASLVAALWLDELALPQIAVVAFVEGSLFVLFTLGETAAVRQVVPPGQLPQALGQNEARNRAAAMAGYPIGGFLFGLGRAIPFLVDAISYLASIAALLLIRRPFQEDRVREERRHLLREIAEGIVWLWRQPFLRVASLLVAGSNFLWQALVLVVIVIAKDNGASSATIGVMLAGFGLGGVLGSLAAPWLQRRISGRAVVIGANWVWAVLVAPVAVVDNPYVLGALFAAMAFVGPAWNVVIGAYQLTLTPEHLLGRVSSAELVVAYGAIPLGSLAAGFLLEGIGSTSTALAVAALMLVLALLATASPAIRGAGSLAGE
jgi:predicted MFS family arabinose efflux permease